MPRRRVPAQAESVALQAYPQPDRPVSPDPILTSELFTDQNAQRVSRQRFGRSISMDRIESALVAAHHGSMRDLTDLSRETIDTDPHLASILQKRFGSLASLPYDILPATGPGIDANRAMFYADVVRWQLNNLRGFREAMYMLAWALFDNRAALEIHWAEADGIGIGNSEFGSVRLVVKSLAWVHPRRLSYGPAREIRIQDERRATNGNFSTQGLALDDVPDKFLYWKPQLFGEYAEREGLAQRCMYWSFFKRFGARERMILMELFSKPWRVIKVDPDSNATAQELSDADEIVDALGGAYTARMPRGTDLDVIQPTSNGGTIHDDVITSTDAQLSKLVLGQTGTTDGISVGLNGGSVMDGMVNEQYGILIRDARMQSERIEEMLTDRIIALNFGEFAVTHAPKFKWRPDRPSDPKEELARLDAALKAGIPVARDEAYEISGFRMPDESDAVIVMEQPPTPPGAANPPAARPVVVFPRDQSPAAGEQLPPPPVASAEGEGGVEPGAPLGAAETAKVITVEEARRGAGLPPFGDARDKMTVRELEEQFGQTPTDTPGEEKPEDQAKQAGLTDDDIAAEPVQIAADRFVLAGLSAGVSLMARGDMVEADDDDHVVAVCARDALAMQSMARRVELCVFAPHDGYTPDAIGFAQLVRDHKQPEGAHGSVEDVLDKGQRRASGITKKMATHYDDAIGELDTPLAIFNAVGEAADLVDLNPLAKELERRILHGLMLGALDSDFEIGTENGTTVQTAKPRRFSELSFTEALKFFKAKAVVTKAQFELLLAEAKKRAFTVAGVFNQQMLQTIRAELSKEIADGADLRAFKKRIKARLTTAGFLSQRVEFAPGQFAMSASHTETVFRTNVLNAYHAGRAEQQQNPVVMKRRPVWQIRAIRDNRARKTHKAAHDTMLLATDPFWQTAYPPFGFNCRCRVVTRGPKFLDQVVAGSTVHGLPDRGFTSGI